MKEIEIRAQRFTATALSLSFENLAEKSETDSSITFQGIGNLAHESVKQICDFCGKSRGIGYIRLTEDGHANCIFCEQLQLFGMNKNPLTKI